VELLGTIEPGVDATSGKPDWIRLIDVHPQLSPVPARWGVNPFSRGPLLFKSKPDTARVLLEQIEIGLIYWAMDDTCRLIVCASAGFEERVRNLAQEVASRLGWSFFPHEQDRAQAAMFCITVSCHGISPAEWPDAISDVRGEFNSRQWHRIVDIRWSGQTLLLIAENDYDASGEALADEFSDTIAAYAPGTRSYSVRIVAVAKRNDLA
jgi:hypothetical protein